MTSSWHHCYCLWSFMCEPTSLILSETLLCFYNKFFSLYAYFEGNFDPADEFNSMTSQRYVIVAIKLCPEVGNDGYIISCHPPSPPPGRRKQEKSPVWIGFQFSLYRCLYHSLGQTKQQQCVNVFQLVVYTAAKTDTRKLIEMIFNTSAGQIVFNSYKDRTPLPEDVARANGHEELAQYLKDINKRYLVKLCSVI